MPLDRRERTANPRVRSRQESDRWKQQYTRIQQRRAITFDEGILGRIKALLADVAMDGVAQGAPVIERRVETEPLGALDRAVDRDPCHHLGKNVVLGLVAPLPDTMVR